MQIHSTLSFPALTNAQVGRQNACDSLEIMTRVPDQNSFPKFLKRNFRWILIPKRLCLCSCMTMFAEQEQSVHRYKHGVKETCMFAGKSVWYVFHNPYLCVGCCGMHKILLSQQHEVVEELARKGREKRPWDAQYLGS